MVTNCVLLVADFYLFCYERDFRLSLCDKKQVDVVEAFNSTSRYLDAIYVNGSTSELRVRKALREIGLSPPVK